MQNTAGSEAYGTTLPVHRKKLGFSGQIYGGPQCPEQPPVPSTMWGCPVALPSVLAMAYSPIWRFPDPSP